MNQYLYPLIALLPWLSTISAAESPARPNVLFIAIDDLKPALGCYGDTHANTPNLDRLAGRALRFDRAYCNQAVCGPSRNAMMTGLRPQTLGIYDLSTNFRVAHPAAITLPQHFLNQGYHTAAIGKILHTGHGNHDDPASWSEKHLHPKADYYALPENRPSADAGGSRGADVYGAATESADVPDNTYEDGLIATEAVKKLATLKDAKAPFYFAVGFRCPHLPFVAPKKYWDSIDATKLPLPKSDTLPKGAPEPAGPSTDELRKYKNIPQGKAVLSVEQKRHFIHGYYAATSYVDACVGRVLDALESSGLADNTIIVVWGDHGYHLGDHGIWGKHTNFELAARIPLMIAVPGKTGAATSALVETVDIYPTLAELAGLPSPSGLDGLSFASLFTNPAKTHRDHVSHVYPRRDLIGNAVRNARYRLIEWSKPGAAHGSGVLELYDYETDPNESTNLAAAQPAVVAKLKAIMASQPALKTQIPMKAAAAKKEARVKDKNSKGDAARAQESTGKKRIVFLAGGPSHGPGLHEYRAGSLLLARALNEQSGLPVKAEVISGWPEDVAVLKGAAALVIYDSATKSIGKHMAEVDALAKAGMGLMFLHYAVHPSAKDGEAYYQPWIGGAFETGYSVNPFWIADLQPLPKHPVSRGITTPVRAHDEFYYNMRFRPDRSQVLDLVTATPSRDNIVAVNNLWTQGGFDGLGKTQTLMWGTQRADGGRGAGFTGGHFHRNWAIDDYRKLVLNAITWVAGLEVPAEGVKSLPLTEEDVNANLDDKGRSAARITLPTQVELTKIKRQPVPTPEEHQAKSPQRREKKRKPEAGNQNVKKEVPEDRTVRVKEAPPQPSDNAVPPAALKVPDDLEVTLWASSPMLFNPTNMDTDRDGRIWVTEGVDYRKKKDRRPEGDRIMVLEDRDKDGRADHSHVFVQDPELVSPLGIAVFGNRIVVSQPPNLIVYTDVDGDLRFDPAKDKRENLLSGFFGNNHDHSLHAVVAGPEGRWYFNQGNTGAQFTTRDGVTYKVGGPYGEGEKISGQRSDDGHIWTGGFLASMHPDGTALRMLGHGFRNSYEHCISSLGDIFQSDNDDPPACRNTWLMEGGFLGFFSRSGTRTWEADRRLGQSIPVAEWRQEDPGTLPPGDVYGRGSPTGVAFYENGALPAKYQGVFLSADARLQNIFGYRPVADGAGKKLVRFDFLRAEPGTQFRPSDVMVGADGAVYVADWYDARVGGHGTQDETLSGAIYRIAPKGFRPQIAVLHATAALTTEDAATLLQSPAPNVRFEGFAALQSMAATKPAEIAPVLQKMLTNASPLLRARAVWLLPFLGSAGVDQVKSRLDDADPDQRILALRALRNAGFDFKAEPAILENLVSDPNPAPRREAAVVLREMPADFRKPLVVKLFTQYDGKDRTYLEACGNAAEGIEEPVWAELREKLAAHDARTWSLAFARITWRLHTPSAITDVLSRATDAQLPPEDRKLAVDTIAFTRCRAALGAMVQLRKAEPVIAEMATAWLLIRATDEWDEFDGRQVLKDEGIYDPDKVVIQEVKMPEPRPKSDALDVKAIMQLKGDAMNGRNVAARCIMCHRIGDQGVEYGPDLRGWAANQGQAPFLTAVIHPTDSIALGFEGQRVPLKDGREVQGLLISAGDPLTVRSTGGVTQMIPRALLDKRTQPLRRSLMLSAEELGLTAQDLADLAAFMAAYK